MGTVEALCVGGKKGEKKTPIPCVSVVQNHGMAGDAHAGPWHRQVSLLAAEDIGEMRQKGLPDLKPGDFAENIVVSGVALNTLGLGSRIRIGSDVELVVAQAGSRYDLILVEGHKSTQLPHKLWLGKPGDDTVPPEATGIDRRYKRFRSGHGCKQALMDHYKTEGVGHATGVHVRESRTG